MASYRPIKCRKCGRRHLSARTARACTGIARRTSSRNPAGNTYGAVHTERIAGEEYVWIRQYDSRGRALPERRAHVAKVTPSHVIVETLHTGIVVRSVPADKWGYRPIKISRKTGKVVGVTEDLHVLKR